MKRSNYQTKQREIILETIRDQNKPLTGPDLVQLLKSNDCSVSQATIYRYLDLLTQQNKIRLFTTALGQKYYEYCFEECLNHSHLKCEKCNQTIHLEHNLLLEVSEMLKKELGFQLNHGKTTYVGICKQCQGGK